MSDVDQAQRAAEELHARLDISWADFVESFATALRAAERRAMPVWQTIETAPKDGTWILLASPPKPHVRDAWQVYVATWERTDYNSEPEWAYGARIGEHAFRYAVYDATHWMPLPELPEIDALAPKVTP